MEAYTEQQDNVDYFINNFRLEGLRYVKNTLTAKIANDAAKVLEIKDQIARLTGDLLFLEDGLVNKRKELRDVKEAIQFLSSINH